MPVAKKASKSLAKIITKREGGQPLPLGVFCLSDPWVFHNAYYGRLLDGLANEAKQAGISLQFFFPKIVLAADGNPALDDVHLTGLEQLAEGRVQGGVVLTGREISKADMARLRVHADSVVILNTDVVLPGFSQVNSGAYERNVVAARHLVLKGHRKIGTIALNKASGYNNACIRALESALSEAGMGLDYRLVEEVDEWDFANPLDLQARFMNLYGHGATAIVCGEVHQAVLGCDFLRRKGIVVPNDVSMVSFGPLPEAARMMDPALTLVESDLIQAGREAFRLYQELRRGAAPRVYTLPWVLGSGGGSVSSPRR